MDKARSPGAEASTSAPKSCWKDKLTEQQLNRKRAADRRLVRESRHRNKNTIVALQERLELLASRQPDKLVAELIKANAALEKEKNSLRNRLLAVCTALGVDVDATHSLLDGCRDDNTADNSETRQSISTEPSRDSCNTSSNILDSDQAKNLDATSSSSHADSIGGISPFPSMRQALGPSSTAAGYSDNDLLEAMILWRGSLTCSLSVFNLASELFFIDRAPGYLSGSKLRSLARCPNILLSIIHSLEKGEPFETTESELVVDTGCTEDNIDIAKKEIVIFAFEAVRPWDYTYKNGRLAMFWALYRVLLLFIFPTKENLSKCPAWCRPVLSQMTHQHPAFIDLLPWPELREYLTQNWAKYQTRRFLSTFVANFYAVELVGEHTDGVFSISSDRSELELMHGSKSTLCSGSSLRMTEGFTKTFPEFARLVETMIPGAAQPAQALLDYGGVKSTESLPVTTAQVSEISKTDSLQQDSSSLDPTLDVIYDMMDFSFGDMSEQWDMPLPTPSAQADLVRPELTTTSVFLGGCEAGLDVESTGSQFINLEAHKVAKESNAFANGPLQPWEPSFSSKASFLDYQIESTLCQWPTEPRPSLAYPGLPFTL